MSYTPDATFAVAAKGVSNGDTHDHSGGDGASITALGTITSAVKSSSASAGIGYAAGAGSTVTQLNTKGDAVTINAICGQITTHNANLAGGAEVTFQVNNTSCAATDVPVLAIASGGTAGLYLLCVSAVAGNSFKITISNVGGLTMGEAIVINFVIFKAVAA